MACSSGGTASVASGAQQRFAMQRQQPHVRRSAASPPRNAPAHGSCRSVARRRCARPARRAGGLSWASSAASPNRMAAAILSSSSRARTATVATRAFGRFVASNAAAMPALGRVAVARVGQHPPVRRRARPAPGRASGARPRRRPRSDGLNAQLYARRAGWRLRARCRRRRRPGRWRGPIARCGPAGWRAGGARPRARVGGDHCLQRGDRRRVAGLAHPGRHQQAARVAPAVRRLRKRRPQRRHGLRGIGRLQDALDHITQPRGGVRFRGVARAAPFDRRVNHGAIPSARPSPRAARTSRSPAPAPAAAGWRCADCWAGRWTPAAR